MIDDAELTQIHVRAFGKLVHPVGVAGNAPGCADASHRGQAAEVDADADGHASVFGGVYDGLDLLPGADVAWVQPKAVHPTLQRLKSKLVVEVDVGDNGDADALDYTGQGFGRLHVRHGTANNVAAGLGGLFDLTDGGVDVAGVRLGHGLNRDRGVPAYLDVADVYRLGNSAPHAANANAGCYLRTRCAPRQSS